MKLLVDVSLPALSYFGGLQVPQGNGLKIRKAEMVFMLVSKPASSYVNYLNIL